MGTTIYVTFEAKNELPIVRTVTGDCRDSILEDMSDLEKDYQDATVIQIFSSNTLDGIGQKEALDAILLAMSEGQGFKLKSISKLGFMGIESTGKVISMPLLSLLIWMLRNFSTAYYQEDVMKSALSKAGINMFGDLTRAYSAVDDLDLEDFVCTLYYIATYPAKRNQQYNKYDIEEGPASYIRGTLSNNATASNMKVFIEHYSDKWDVEEVLDMLF